MGARKVPAQRKILLPRTAARRAAPPLSTIHPHAGAIHPAGLSTPTGARLRFILCYPYPPHATRGGSQWRPPTS